MKSLIFAAVAVTAATVAQPSAAAVQLLNFSGAICGATGGAVCANGAEIAASYGDTPELDVRYQAIDTINGLPVENVLRLWTSGFGNLQGIAYAGGGNTSAIEIFFKPAAGYEVALLDFDFASYQRRVPTVPIRISSGAGALIQEGSYATGASTHANLAVNSDYFTSGIVLRFGPNAFDSGIDNIRFDVREAPISAAPEPGVWALMLLGFGGAGATLRRRHALGVA